MVTNARQEAFSRIYDTHEWGGTSRSGPGSDPALLGPYTQLLRALLARPDVSSVVDIGCGDWAISRTIDWTGVQYTGVDVVPQLIAHLNATFARDNVKFICADLTTDDLPSGDLCIVKDALQHLSNDSVSRFLRVLKGNFSLALMTNDITHIDRGGWRTLWKQTSIEPNIDIPDGGYRPLRLRDAPFFVPAERVGTWEFRFPRQVQGRPGTTLEVKESLLWTAADRNGQESA